MKVKEILLVLSLTIAFISKVSSIQIIESNKCYLIMLFWVMIAICKAIFTKRS